MKPELMQAAATITAGLLARKPEPQLVQLEVTQMFLLAYAALEDAEQRHAAQKPGMNISNDALRKA